QPHPSSQTDTGVTINARDHRELVGCPAGIGRRPLPRSLARRVKDAMGVRNGLTVPQSGSQPGKRAMSWVSVGKENVPDIRFSEVEFVNWLSLLTSARRNVYVGAFAKTGDSYSGDQ